MAMSPRQIREITEPIYDAFPLPYLDLTMHAKDPEPCSFDRDSTSCQEALPDRIVDPQDPATFSPLLLLHPGLWVDPDVAPNNTASSTCRAPSAKPSHSRATHENTLFSFENHDLQMKDQGSDRSPS